MSAQLPRLLDAREECAKLIDTQVTPLLENGSLPPMWPWWLPLVDAIEAHLTGANSATEFPLSPGTSSGQLTTGERRSE